MGYTIFLFLFKNVDCWYTLELSRRGGSNECPYSISINNFFFSENFQFLVVKFSIYLNGRVLVILALQYEMFSNVVKLMSGKCHNHST